MKYLLVVLLLPFFSCNKSPGTALPPVSDYTCGRYIMDGWYSTDLTLTLSYNDGTPLSQQGPAYFSVASTGCAVTFLGFGWLPYEDKIVVDTFAQYFESGARFTRAISGECSLEEECWVEITQHIYIGGELVAKVLTRGDLENMQLLPQSEEGS